MTELIDIKKLPWWRGNSKQSNLLFTEVSFFRNSPLKGFWHRLSPADRQELKQEFMVCLKNPLNLKPLKNWESLTEAQIHHLQYLNVWPKFYGSDAISELSELPLWWGWNSDYTVFGGIGFQEHVVWGSVYSGLPKKLEILKLSKLEVALAHSWAWEKEWGYLMAHPELMGQGIQIVTQIHLPFLSDLCSDNQLSNSIHALGAKVLPGNKGAVREGWVKLVYTKSFGKTIAATYSDFCKILDILFQLEFQIAQEKITQDKVTLQNQVSRAWAILRDSHLLTEDEFYFYDSWVRRGITCKLLPSSAISKMNQAFVFASDEYWTKFTPQSLEVAKERATVVRKIFGKK